MVKRLRVWWASRQLRLAHNAWQQHVMRCEHCRVAGHGNRQQRRRFGSKFCPTAGPLLVRAEATIERFQELTAR